MEVSCPTGLHFDAKLNACNTPELAQCDQTFQGLEPSNDESIIADEDDYELNSDEIENPEGLEELGSRKTSRRKKVVCCKIFFKSLLPILRIKIKFFSNNISYFFILRFHKLGNLQTKSRKIHTRKYQTKSLHSYHLRICHSESQILEDSSPRFLGRYQRAK